MEGYNFQNVREMSMLECSQIKSVGSKRKMIKESHVIIDRYPRERQLDPELGGIFDLRHQEYTFP